MPKQRIAADLGPLLKQPVLLDALMRDYTTWKIGGPADVLAQPEDERELAAVLRYLHQQQIAWMVIGNGSNLLVGDRGIRGVVIKPGEGLSRAVWRGPEAEAGAGMPLAALALEAAERSLAGLAFARGIPGSVGGGVRMNAGAYEHNLSEVVTHVAAIDYSGESLLLPREEISFAYRESSLFELKAVIIRVGFRLLPGDREQLMAEMKDYAKRRSLAQPLEYPSCGSVFRNPPNDHAGHLIEMAGLRGTACGGVEVSAKHGNFIINRGQGTAAQVRELIELVQQSVYEYAGIKLEPEVRFVGEF